VAIERLMRQRCHAPTWPNWQQAPSTRISTGFYISEAQELVTLMTLVAKANRKMLDKWKSLGPRYLPFADAATEDLPLGRLMRLSMFQWSIGMAAVLLTGTLNRVMIVELGVPTSLVALMVAIPVLAAPFRALIGHRSDTYKSALGVRRVPYIWLGTILQFGGLAIMPFALLLLQSQTTGPEWAGPAGAFWPSCSPASACTWRRPPGWRWPPTCRPRTTGRGWWR
jgi:hypothetical protein